jgi:hypothetical protein
VNKMNYELIEEMSGLPVTSVNLQESLIRPDPHLPLDRLSQPAFAANPNGIVSVLRLLFSGQPSVLVDPLCGAGSSGIAARLMRVPFAGIELDCDLAAVAWAKAVALTATIRRLAPQLPAHVGDLRGICNRSGLTTPLIRLARALLCMFDAPISDTAMAVKKLLDDAEQLPEPQPGSRVIHGDAIQPNVWSSAMGGVDCRNVWIYMSPPFEISSYESVANGGVQHHPGDLIVSVLCACRRVVPHARALVEWYETSSGWSGLSSICTQLRKDGFAVETIEAWPEFRSGRPLLIMSIRW